MNKLIERLKTSVKYYLRDSETLMVVVIQLVLLVSMLCMAIYTGIYYEGGCLKSLPQEELKQCQLRVEENRKDPLRSFSFPR